MFENPEAKRVKRSKLFSSSSSPASSDNEGQPLDKSVRSRSKGSTKQHKSKAINGDGVSEVDAEPMNIDYGFEYDFIDTVKIVTPTAISTNKSKVEVLDGHSGDNQSETNQDQVAHDLSTSEPKEQSYDFLLFKPKLKSKPTNNTVNTSTASQAKTSDPTTTTKITIRSPTPESLTKPQGEGTILSSRPLTQYFTAHLPAPTLHRLKSEYINSAITGPEIQTLSTLPWAGCVKPWRVIHIPPSRLISQPPLSPPPPPPLTPVITTTTPYQQQQQTTSTKPSHLRIRPRPSKKRRIYLRKRIEARALLASQTLLSAEAEKEKRTRRNREKKVKRKEREKRKKMEGKGKVIMHDGEGDGEKEKEESSESGSGSE